MSSSTQTSERRFSHSKDAYAHIWQDSLDHHIAVQMDHVSVAKGYRVWHGASHLDDGAWRRGRAAIRRLESGYGNGREVQRRRSHSWDERGRLV